MAENKIEFEQSQFIQIEAQIGDLINKLVSTGTQPIIVTVSLISQAIGSFLATSMMINPDAPLEEIKASWQKIVADLERANFNGEVIEAMSKFAKGIDA